LLKLIKSEFCKFIFFGAVNTVLSYAIYVIFQLFLIYPVAYSLAYILGIFISYYLNSRFVFKREFSLIKAFQYPMVYLLQYLLGVSLLFVLIEIFSLNKFIAPALVIVFTIPVTFSLSRFIIKGHLGKG
jgi:putative flippase GtrA